MKNSPCLECGLQCRHTAGGAIALWSALWDRLGADQAEVAALKREIRNLMSGGPLGDGIGPGNATRAIFATLGYSLTERETWTIWRCQLDDMK